MISDVTLMHALRDAVDSQELREIHWGYASESAYLTKIREALDSLRSGAGLEIHVTEDTGNPGS